MKFRAYIRLQRKIKDIWSHVDLKVGWIPFVETREEAKEDLLKICKIRYPEWDIESMDIFEQKEKWKDEN